MKLCCHWVPNTMNRIVVTAGGYHAELSVQEVKTLCGRTVLEELYLTGRSEVEVAGPIPAEWRQTAHIHE